MQRVAHSTVNEDRFHARPRDAVTGIIVADEQSRCLDELTEAGFFGQDVHVLDGIEGARILDTFRRHHGLRARAVRFSQSAGAEGNELRIQDAALLKGLGVFRIRAVGRDQMLRAARVLVECGGDRVLHYDTSGPQLLY